MFLPIGDTPNLNCRPWTTYGIIALNLAVFLLYTLPLGQIPPDLNDPMLAEYLRALGVTRPVPIPVLLEQVSAYDIAVFRWGFRPADASIVTLFSAMFLHGGWLHLAGNMLFLYIYGDNVECRLGRSLFLLVYLGTGIVSTLFFALFALGSPIPLVGASGAISGILGCYFLWFPHNRIKVFVFLFPLIMTTVLVPARLVLGIYLLLENLLPFLFTPTDSGGVAYGAHLGGFIAGLALAWGMNRFRTRSDRSVGSD